MSELNIVRLADYRQSAFTVDHHELRFFLYDDHVRVQHQQRIRRIQAQTDERGWTIEREKNLVLNGEALELLHIAVDGEALDAARYAYDNDLLTLFDVGDEFLLETEVRLHPDRNSELSGLYRSNGIFCTQCEAQGFRRISFTLDRPDILATYRVHIEADKTHNPVLLSNGDQESHGEVADNRHYTVWYDPHPKPSYLFALVAGDLAQVSRRITTPQGKKIDLRLYTEPAFINQTDYALNALADAINWDEKRFNLVYDLNRFNVVAVSDFNMGAMENKSLNIFNTKYVLADTETATDADFHNIQAVIGHEYFHNWTGNRITCRDWFQLSLKEGLTVFRDQEFSADMNERDLERIDNVGLLRRLQFAEDAGPMRHPVQPQEYAAIDNFYTATVYEKGAEIIRMMHTILGEELFQKGMALYIGRHDGQAVRIEDFARCMEEAGGFPFSGHFFDWYTTAGTPKLSFTSSYNHRERRFTLSVGQDISAVSPPRALLIPIRLALISPNGRQYRFDDGSYSQLLLLEKNRGSWSFERADGDLIPVLMMGFSAPVYYHYQYSNAELAALVQYAPDGFARYEAIRTAYHKLFLTALKNPKQTKEQARDVVEMMLAVLMHEKRSPGEKALLLALPALEELLPHLPAPLDMDAMVAAYERVVRIIALKMRRAWSDYLENEREVAQPRYSVRDAGIRALRAVALKALAVFEDDGLRERLLREYQEADCMTARLSAIEALNRRADRYRDEVLTDFRRRFAAHPLVIDKWFSLQAKESDEEALERISALAAHEDFNIGNPNRFSALIGAFAQSNPAVFHCKDGAGYRFVCAQIRRIITDNPQLSARLLGCFAAVGRLDAQRKALALDELKALGAIEGLSVDVREVLQRLADGLR